MGNCSDCSKSTQRRLELCCSGGIEEVAKNNDSEGIKRAHLHWILFQISNNPKAMHAVIRLQAYARGRRVR